MNTFSLDSKNSIIEFHLNSVDSYLHIDTITLANFGSIGNEWTNIFPKLELKANLKYLVYADSNDISTDIRSFCIPLKIDPIQSQPVFKINRTIKNKMLTIGINSEKKCYSTLKLELKETAIISKKYELRFEVNLHGMVKVSE
jgi:hypothetical protein